MTTTFKINSLDRDTADGFVTVAHWTASQVNGDFSASIVNTQSFTKEDGVNLIPYADLTEATVIGWVQSALGADTVAAIDAALAAQIADQQAPKKATGLPWAQA
jgi:hypothetical protein